MKVQIVSNKENIAVDHTYTAIAKTVRLTVAMAALAIINKKITEPGIKLPISKEVYDPILRELQEHGIEFKEKKEDYLGYNPHNLGA